MTGNVFKVVSIIKLININILFILIYKVIIVVEGIIQQ